MVCFGVIGYHLFASSLGSGACTFIEGGRDCVSVLYIITDLLRMRPTHSNVCYCLHCYGQKNEVHREGHPKSGTPGTDSSHPTLPIVFI